jgi:hypothetical protein
MRTRCFFLPSLFESLLHARGCANSLPTTNRKGVTPCSRRASARMATPPREPPIHRRTIRHNPRKYICLSRGDIRWLLFFFPDRYLHVVRAALGKWANGGGPISTVLGQKFPNDGHFTPKPVGFKLSQLDSLGIN